MIFTHEYHFYAQLGYKSEMMYRIVGKMGQISIYFECSLHIRKYKLQKFERHRQLLKVQFEVLTMFLYSYFAEALKRSDLPNPNECLEACNN